MRVTMLTDRRVNPHGLEQIDAEAGETYDMGDGVALSLINRGLAEPADGDSHPGHAGELHAVPHPADGTLSPEISNEHSVAPWQTPEYQDAWHTADEAQLLADIAAWGTGAGTEKDPLVLAPPPHVIAGILRYEQNEQNGPNREAVVEALTARVNEHLNGLENKDAGAAPETKPDAPTVADLMKHGRAKLNELAAGAGVKDAAGMKDKREVAEAIVAAAAA